MEYDPLRTIPTEKQSDTPEVDQECLHLQQGIDIRIDHWFDWAITDSDEKNPTFLSRIIFAECEPLTRPAEDVVSVIRFKRNHSRESIRNLDLLIRTQNEVAAVVQDASFDSIEVELPIMARSFEFTKQAQENPNSNPEMIEALTHLKRMYIARQEIAKKLTGSGIFDEASKYSWILKRVVDEN